MANTLNDDGFIILTMPSGTRYYMTRNQYGKFNEEIFTIFASAMWVENEPTDAKPFDDAVSFLTGRLTADDIVKKKKN